MRAEAPGPPGTWPSRLVATWARHRTALLSIGLVLMGLVLVPRWTHELDRLLVEEGAQGARDLAMRHGEVGRWFADDATDGPLAPNVYPPASYVILWPFLGWLDLTAARWLWAATLLAALAWLTAIVVRESGVESRLARWFLIAWVPSTYAVTVTAGNGQLGVHVLPALLSSILIARRGRGGWPSDLASASLFTLCLVKPSLAAPFFWVLLSGRRGARRGALVVSAYAGLTALAVSFRPEGVIGILRSWVAVSRETALSARYGYMNLHEWMSAAGMRDWIPYGSLLVLALLGAWVLGHRGAPVWLALGVAAIVARTWTYHALYDDLLLLVPIVALLRVAREAPAGEGRAAAAGFVVFAGWCSSLLPARLLTAPPPWDLAFRAGQTVVWAAVLVALGALVSRPLPDSGGEEERTPRVPSRARRVLGSPGALLTGTAAVTALAAVLATWPLALHMGSATLRTGEMLLAAWQLNDFHRALLTDPLGWADAHVFFPYGSAAALNDLLLAHAVLTLPAAAAESPVLALNLALLGGIVLCGVFAHLLAGELTGDPRAATVAGVLFALAPFRFLHLGHLSVAAAWAIPLFFWALLRHLREPSWGRATLGAASGVAVGLSSLYHAAYVAPIVPLVLLFGARRGPGGRRTWLPLLVTGLVGLALLAWFLAPYAAALRTFGVAAASADLLRYGADLSSLGQKPFFLGGTGDGRDVDPEARLYPGVGLAALAAAGVLLATLSTRRLRGWRRSAATSVLALAGVSVLGLLLPLSGPAGAAWRLAVLGLIWLGPVVAISWAIASTGPGDAKGPPVAIRLGAAGSLLSFVLALGPQARHLAEPIGLAPYWLLVQLSPAFQGARAPARFGGILILFLALLAAGAAGELFRRDTGRRLASLGLALAVLAAGFAELPQGGLTGASGLIPLPDLKDPAYAWIRSQPGRFGILELPDWPTGGGQQWEYKGWRSLRFMLASKQHGRHLANGTARIEPFLWRRFRRVEHWTDEFFAFVAAYFPVRHVLVHEGGIPEESRAAIWARLETGADGWREVFRSEGARVYAVDRSFGRGTFVDRLFLRRETAPRARVAFSARVAPDARAAGDGVSEAATLDLLRDGEPVEAWRIDGAWQRLEATVNVEESALADGGWPRAAVRLTWRVEPDTAPPFEIRDLSVER